MAESPRNPFQAYKRAGKTLKAPFNDLRERLAEGGTELAFNNWRDVKLPEFLWLALALWNEPPPLPVYETLRSVASRWPARPDGAKWYASPGSHSYIASLPRSTGQALTNELVNSFSNAELFAPIRLLKDLPGHELWVSALPEIDAGTGWEQLGNAVLRGSDHQGRVATDICWFISSAAVSSGMFDKGRFRRELDAKRRGYPENRESAGGAFRAFEGNDRAIWASPWAPKFWTSVYLEHEPQPHRGDRFDVATVPYLAQYLFASYRIQLGHYFWETRKGSDDWVHEVLFGILLLSCDLALESVELRAHNRALGIFALRSVAEMTINLGYLVQQNRPELWRKFRDVGYGRAMQIAKKNRGSQSRGKTIDTEYLEAFAQDEKRWELTDIELGDWSGTDLRKRAEMSGLKDIYDRFYDYGSSFVHGDWLAANVVSLGWDLNPFHRLQHVPIHKPRLLQTNILDLTTLLSRQLVIAKQVLPVLEFEFPEVP